MTTFITLLILRRPFFALVRYPALAVADALFAAVLAVWVLVTLGAAGYSPAAAAGLVLGPAFLLAVAGYAVGSRLAALAWLAAGRRSGRYPVARYRRLVRGLLPATALLLRGTVLVLVLALAVSWAELFARSLGLDEWRTVAGAAAVNGVISLTLGELAARNGGTTALAGAAVAHALRGEALGSLAAGAMLGIKALAGVEFYVVAAVFVWLFAGLVVAAAGAAVVVALLWRAKAAR